MFRSLQILFQLHPQNDNGNITLDNLTNIAKEVLGLDGLKIDPPADCKIDAYSLDGVLWYMIGWRVAAGGDAADAEARLFFKDIEDNIEDKYYWIRMTTTRKLDIDATKYNRRCVLETSTSARVERGM